MTGKTFLDTFGYKSSVHKNQKDLSKSTSVH